MSWRTTFYILTPLITQMPLRIQVKQKEPKRSQREQMTFGWDFSSISDFSHPKQSKFMTLFFNCLNIITITDKL